MRISSTVFPRIVPSIGIVFAIVFAAGCYYDARPSAQSSRGTGSQNVTVDSAVGMPSAAELAEEREEFVELRGSLESLEAEGKTLSEEEIEKIIVLIDSATQRLESIEKRLQEIADK